jgi:hypothetical protein
MAVAVLATNVIAADALVGHNRAMKKVIGIAAVFSFIGLSAAPVVAAPLEIPFDFSRMELGVEVSIKGKLLYAILDTGVDPSVIDLADANALGLKVDRKDSGEAGGFGEGRGATVSPTMIEGLTIRGRRFPAFEALAADMALLSAHDQHKLDAVLGYSFLSDKIVLIDYVAHTLAILDGPRDAEAIVRNCQTRWGIPLKTFDSFPVIPGFRFGKASGPVTLDTGSSGGVGLFGTALDLEGLRASLVDQGASVRRGARGDSKVENYILNEPVGFGPFILPAGQKVFVHNQQGSSSARVANVGNTLFEGMKIKMLLDYRTRAMTFYGGCR